MSFGYNYIVWQGLSLEGSWESVAWGGRSGGSFPWWVAGKPREE